MKKRKIRDTKAKDYLLNFTTEAEIEMYKHFQRAAIDLDCSVRHLILEAMKYYEKKWK